MMETRAAQISKLTLLGIEALTMITLVALVIFALLGLVVAIPGLSSPPFLGTEQLGHVLDHVLAIFILIELLATAVAYIRGVDIVRRLFETMLVALARKLITLDLATTSVGTVGMLALLLAAVGVTWMMVGKAHRTRPVARSNEPQPAAT